LKFGRLEGAENNGWNDGDPDGLSEGFSLVGKPVGTCEGSDVDGLKFGRLEGAENNGWDDGHPDGLSEGFSLVGKPVGTCEGSDVEPVTWDSMHTLPAHG